MGVRYSKDIARSEITRGFRISENLLKTKGGDVWVRELALFL